MSDRDGPVVARTTGIRCESYPDECAFAMQAGVFADGTGADAILPSLRPAGQCPTCGCDLVAWDPAFPSAAPGRPTEW